MSESITVECRDFGRLWRAAYLLDAVDQFMRENSIAAECTTIYDDAQCDGNCLAEDCRFAAEELRELLKDFSPKGAK